MAPWGLGQKEGKASPSPRRTPFRTVAAALPAIKMVRPVVASSCSADGTPRFSFLSIREESA